MAATAREAVDSAERGSARLAERIQAALRAGDGDAALELCNAALAGDPRDSAAERHRAVLLAAAGRRSAAIAAGRRACGLAPDDARSWSDLGRAHALLGDYEDAVTCFAEALSIDARLADAWHNLGTALHKLHREANAFAALKNALLLDSTRADTYLSLGNLLFDAGQVDDALECFERAAKHDPTMARARSGLADQLAARGQLARAEGLFRESLALDRDHVAGWLGLGRALEDVGDADGALSCYRNVLARAPGHAAALGHYLALLRAPAPAGLIAAAEKAIADPSVADEPRAIVGYGLAKHCDRQGAYAAAAAAVVAANTARRRATGPLDRTALAARVDGLVEHYDAAFFGARRAFGMGTDQPVFIVGLPRSGTTLTEQIVAAHPLLHGAGELPDLARLAVRAATDEGKPWRAAAMLDEPTSRDYARRYVQALRDGVPRGRLRISDKSPLNFFQLAFAAVLFPKARVIHCVRDARDVALSIYMENFNAEQRYATDFDDLAFFTGEYRRLMAHWRAVLPLPMLEVRYEDTVRDVEAQARRIVEFLGVPWDRRCLDFHDSRRTVQTPSRWQVREPIYARSVGRWRRYAQLIPRLGEAFDGLGDAA
jgi:tetratricopeptide (TPR) repeat protein